jgi:hypothetical protein
MNNVLTIPCKIYTMDLTMKRRHCTYLARYAVQYFPKHSQRRHDDTAVYNVIATYGPKSHILCHDMKFEISV